MEKYQAMTDDELRNIAEIYNIDWPPGSSRDKILEEIRLHIERERKLEALSPSKRTMITVPALKGLDKIAAPTIVIPEKVNYIPMVKPTKISYMLNDVDTMDRIYGPIVVPWETDLSTYNQARDHGDILPINPKATFQRKPAQPIVVTRPTFIIPTAVPVQPTPVPVQPTPVPVQPTPVPSVVIPVRPAPGPPLITKPILMPTQILSPTRPPIGGMPTAPPLMPIKPPTIGPIAPITQLIIQPPVAPPKLTLAIKQEKETPPGLTTIKVTELSPRYPVLGKPSPKAVFPTTGIPKVDLPLTGTTVPRVTTPFRKPDLTQQIAKAGPGLAAPDNTTKTILNQIDPELLTNERIGKNKKGYSLTELQEFAKKLGFTTSGKKKQDLIDYIQKVRKDMGII